MRDDEETRLPIYSYPAAPSVISLSLTIIRASKDLIDLKAGQ